MTKDQLEKVLALVKERTKKEAVSIVINTERMPGLFDSKFGGVPYWDLTMEYPKDSEGNKLVLLAQFNLEENELHELLPKKGMLQFYIATDDMWGMELDEPEKQNGFRVVYHETINKTVKKEEIVALDIPLSTDDSLENGIPVSKEYAVDFIKKECSMGPEDYRFDSIFCEAAEELHFKIKENQDVFDVFLDALSEEEVEERMEELCCHGHWLLGYPYFTQTDPREYEKRDRYYDTMLFQMDSDCVSSEEDEEYNEDNDRIMWGDMGVGNFFINKEDLKKGDFSKVLYNWDCC